MKVLFESQDLWSVIDNGFVEPRDQTTLSAQQRTKLKDTKKKHRKALFLIYQAVDEVIFERIPSSTSSKEAWDTLHKTYKGEDKVRVVKLQTLRCEFDGIKMKESEPVEDYYNRIVMLTNQIRINGEDIDDKKDC